jgi:hypothetical protein
MMYPTIRQLYCNGTIFGFVLGDELVWSGVEWRMVETAANLLRHDFPGSVIWCATSPSQPVFQVDKPVHGFQHHISLAPASLRARGRRVRFRRRGLPC